jgi:adenosine/AMP kinase
MKRRTREMSKSFKKTMTAFDVFFLFIHYAYMCNIYIYIIKKKPNSNELFIINHNVIDIIILIQ